MILRVEEITKKFGNTNVVNKLSFNADKGDIVGLLGPNGAGKTTTMRMITSFYYPTKGNIFLNNLNTQKYTAKTQKSIGYLPENNPLYLDMLVIDYLNMTINIMAPNLSESQKQNRIKQATGHVNIKDKLGTVISELSKGYKQRVGIAAALLHEPDLLVLDEPNEGLDPKQRIEIRNLIKELAKEKAIIISTHVMEEVKAMCNKVVVINNGKLITQGKPDELTKTNSIKIKIEGANIKKELSKLVKTSDESLDVTKNDKNMYDITIQTTEKIQPQLSKLAGKNNWTIWELEKVDSLEEIFKKLD